ncbi:hypothetical protein BLNAU_5535 [Blattamonas nauphoetae]|uniref:Uncharacterized protein n=1 Tax=Blattamonas nauphoetae TaxID=2049346 RepID=A0ABQ9Y6U3_9EUKA|nr:hypothetical protein BLNAU_5535 [Blattamonas nauphoetae]
MFPHLVPLLQETSIVFLEHVAVKGIDKLRAIHLSVSQRRSSTSILVQIGLNVPTTNVIGRIMSTFANLMRWWMSSPWKEIKELMCRVLVEEGCEDLYASAAFDTHASLRFRAEMNHPLHSLALP